MTAGPADVMMDVRSRRLRPVYLLYGEEEYLRDEAVRKLIDACLDPDMRDFNLAVFRAGETDVEPAVTALMSAPAFAPRRVVVVRGFDELGAEEQKVLVDAIQRMPRTSVAILVATSADERTWACRAVAQTGMVVRYRRMYESEAASWLAALARERGINLRPQAIDYLVRTLGTSAARLAQGLENACDYAGIAAGDSVAGPLLRGGPGSPRTITLEHMMAASAGEPGLGIFDLVDAIGQRDTHKAVAAARRLLGFGEPSGRILGMIARQVRLILQTKTLQAAGMTRQGIAGVTHLQDFMIRKCLAQARNFDTEDLEDALVTLAAADVELKTSAAAEAVVLERLIVRLCTHRARGR